jgi:hypothetical protein
MKTFLLTIFTALFFSHASGQLRFAPVDMKLKTIKTTGATQLICSSSTLSIKFSLKRHVTVTEQNNFVTIDSQAIQITPLKFSGYQKETNKLSVDSQKQLLDTYSKYELEYFANDLGIELINPSNQWVMIKSRGWFIWYFRIGNVPAQVSKPTTIQLFASTVIGDKILTINAPLPSDTDFNKAGLIVNDMMESLIITKQ